MVLSTITHLNGYVLRIWLEGMALPLEPTDTHRLYSEDRCDWVPAGKLAGGDRLRTLHGPAEITRIDSKSGVHRVYNIEVETEHCYFVSTNGVLSHNTNPCGRLWLKRIHSEGTIKSGSNRFSYDHWSQRSTNEIVESLAPGRLESLKAKPDGRIFDGNTRVLVLEERGYDIQRLPYELLE